MNYQETLQYLFTNLPMFSRSGTDAYKTDITNTVLLCEAVGNPQNKIKTIHIAGTNGKGSVSHMLAAIFQQCGYKTGLYTSPHLKDFRERIKIDGQMIPEDFIVSFVEKIRATSESINPSFFELTVAMMLDYFAQEEVDIAIVETGLGGRLDSTNIIKPILSIITNIGYDHMNILGNTLQEIAFEKAGIIKDNTPSVIGETLPETKPIFLKAALQWKSDIVFAEEQYAISKVQSYIEKIEIELENKKSHQLKNYTLDLNGIYQQKNLCTIITAVDVLQEKGYLIDEEQMHYALSSVKKINGLFGRWDVIHKEPLIVVDVAHNQDGIKLLLTQLSLCKYKNLHIVFGIVKDKEIATILSLLPKKATYYFTKAQIPRALPEQHLMEKAMEYNLHGNYFSDVKTALSEARKNAAKDDMILVCGSVYVAGEVYENLESLLL